MFFYSRTDISYPSMASRHHSEYKRRLALNVQLLQADLVLTTALIRELQTAGVLDAQTIINIEVRCS